ncbi:SusC/RagA family TonB-linked outer membrane protein [Porphyromonas pogonae]|uniref:SusC/RagA family TonB-linked outer membrane protein n=1 Tax=Porphyromonas pogonae TaxID=867595 RepID=UPI002E7A2710|nr:SusC/RagA family TonB-linked outer membrane protein [Porphyromonas pogonae]
MKQKHFGLLTLVLSMPLLGAGHLQAATVADKNESVNLPELNMQQGKKITVKGNVTDNKGEALIGVSVAIKGTSSGATTDVDGNFTLQVTPGATLEITYVGYKPQTVNVTNQTSLKIVMQEDATALDAVVVTALGIKRSQKALSYNVQEVKSEALTTVKDANFMNALSGKVAGVNINASSAGIGGATRVVMRGPKSMTQSNQALYVIDGVPIFNTNGGATEGIYSSQPTGEGISDINPDDIASISVLSGPAAAALYGSSAAQGVIMITTKKGREGKISVMLSNSSSFSAPFIMPEFQTEYINNTGEVKTWGSKQASPFGAYDPKKFFNTGSNIQNTVSLTIGNEKNQTYLSIGSTNAKGIIPNSKYDRYNFTFRNTTKFLDDKLTLDFGFNFVKQKDQNLMAQGQYFNPLVALYLFPRGESFESVRTYEIWDPTRKIYTQNWNFGDALKMQNPYWTANRMNRYADKKRYMGNISLKYQIFDWLDVTGRARADIANILYEDKRYASTIDIFAHSPYGFYGYNKTEEKSVYADLMANINKRFDDYSISSNIGISTNKTDLDSRGFQGGLRNPSNMFNPNQINYGTPTNDNRPIYTDHSHLSNSVFANVELGWKNMLYLTMTGREDWDSALAYTNGNPFFYPSVGLSGIISDMVKLPEWFNYLKARASWAKVGSPIPAHISSPNRYVYNPASQSYSTVTYKFPQDFFPEQTYSWEGGITAKFLNNKLSLDATFYQSNTKNQTFLMPITPTEGFDHEYIQAGNVRNRGLELSLGYNNTWGDFNWNSVLTYSTNRNKIIELIPGSKEPISKGGLNGANVYLKEGGSMGDIYINKDIKRDPEGNAILDAKGNIMLTDLPSPIFKGSVLPKGNLGWVNDFTWKGINFGFMFSARFGGIVLSQTQAILDEYGVSKASAIARDNGGIPVNKGIISAEGFYSVTGGDNPLWSQYIYDATNVRLQEAHLSYTLPSKWLSNKAKLSLGITARNLFMIYNKAPFDPELTASTGTYYQGFDYFMQPSLRNFGFNIKLQF